MKHFNFVSVTMPRLTYHIKQIGLAFAKYEVSQALVCYEGLNINAFGEALLNVTFFLEVLLFHVDSLN